MGSLRKMVLSGTGAKLVAFRGYMDVKIRKAVFLDRIGVLMSVSVVSAQPKKLRPAGLLVGQDDRKVERIFQTLPYDHHEIRTVGPAYSCVVFTMAQLRNRLQGH
jgi:hypothetical protein